MFIQDYGSLAFSEHLVPVLLASLSDENEEVRSNAAYAIGVLCQYGGDVVVPALPHVMQVLYQQCIQPGDMVRFVPHSFL